MHLHLCARNSERHTGLGTPGLEHVSDEYLCACFPHVPFVIIFEVLSVKYVVLISVRIQLCPTFLISNFITT